MARNPNRFVRRCARCGNFTNPLIGAITPEGLICSICARVIDLRATGTEATQPAEAIDLDAVEREAAPIEARPPFD